MSLSYEQVSFQYRGTPMGVFDVNLTLESGELVALIGPSGSGKTTLLRLTAGLLTGHSGHIRLGERDLSNVPVHQREIGMMFQHYALFPHLTVAENVAYGLKMRGVAKAARRKTALEMLELVGLSAHIDRLPGQMSGGQQQRVALARALAFGPQALLLDEPLSALDASIRGQLRDQIRTLQQQFGATTLLVTHDQEEALTMSDRIVVMRDGKIEQDGTPREIYEEPKNLFVAGFIGEINMFNATVIERLDEQRVRANVEGRECNIYVNFAVEPGQKLHVLLRPEDLRVEEINDDNHAEGLIGYVRERNYKGMTLESVVELENGKMVMVSEFFNEDDPDFDHSLDQKMAINWVESWEVVLADEEHK